MVGNENAVRLTPPPAQETVVAPTRPPSVPPLGLILLAPLLVLQGVPAPAQPAERGEVVFRARFDEPDALKPWQNAAGPGVALEPGPAGSHVLRIERPEKEGPGHRNVRAALPVERLRGARVRVEATIKAEGVARPPNPWNGVKCMVHTVGPGGPRWMQQNDLFGDFDWKPAAFIAEIPADTTEAWLILGLELTTGVAWFDDIRMTVVGHRRSRPAEKPAGPVFKGHDLPRLRGAMISPRVTEDDLRVLGAEWRANHVRWQLLWGGFPRSPADGADLDAYDAWLNSALDHLDRLLPVCEEVGLMVLIDLHTPPGGRNDASECLIFKEKRYQDAFVAVWEKIARRYRGKRAVWGYDLVNEPVEGVVAEGLLDWHALATLTARRIRQIDPQSAIVVEPAPWGSPEGLDWFEPLDVPGVVYSVHLYQPFRFTHQGIYGNPAGVAYPGEVDGKHWDKEQLRRALRPAIDYQRDYGVHIYLGEFSAIRWAPSGSAYQYLRDCIELFEEHEWDWAYHAFREWDGWSVEHGPERDDRSRSPTPADRERLLRSWYEKNRRAS
jgi:endoglucanase